MSRKYLFPDSTFHKTGDSAFFGNDSELGISYEGGKAYVRARGVTEFYHGSTKVLELTSGGIKVTGTIYVNGEEFVIPEGGTGEMVYPAAGIALSTGSAWGTSIVNNSGNWNTAYGWGNHAGLYEPVISKSTGFLTWSGTAWVWDTNSYSETDHIHDYAPLTHNLVDPIYHPVSGLTAGHFLKATSSALYAFEAHGLTYSDVGAAAASHSHAESTITFTDITTNNASLSRHGYLPKLSGVPEQYLDSTGSWSVPAGVVYPTAGLVVSTGSAWGTSVTDNSTNWNTAYGWGDHDGLYAPVVHNLIDVTAHPVSGLTTGHFLKATSSALYAFEAHGLTYTDVGAAAASHTHAESTITFTDITTNNASISRHGYLPKLSAVPGEFLDSTGAWSTPATGGVTDGDKGDITVASSGSSWTIDAAAVTYSKIQNLTADTFLANISGVAGSVGEVAVNRIPLFTSAITGTPSSSTYLRGDGAWVTPTVAVSDGDKGDITVSSSGTAWAIDNSAVTYAKIQNVSAQNRILGRISAGTATVAELTGTDVTSILDNFSTSASTKGTVPGSSGVGTAYFLRADATWAIPGGGPWTMLSCTADQLVTNSSTLVASSYMTFTTQANTQYHIRIRALFNSSSAAADIKYRVTHSGTTTRVRRVMTYSVPNGTSATMPTVLPATAFDSSDRTLLATVVGDSIVYEDIYLQVGASGGTFRLEFAQNTITSGQSVTLYEGSYMEYMSV